jgi:hypothetical protein
VAQDSASDSPRELEQEERSFLVAELERRIEEFEGLDESAFGRFTALDWLLCVLGALILPHLALWWFTG